MNTTLREERNNNYIVVRISLYESQILYENVERPLERTICDNFVEINFVKKKKKRERNSSNLL